MGVCQPFAFVRVAGFAPTSLLAPVFGVKWFDSSLVIQSSLLFSSVHHLSCLYVFSLVSPVSSLAPSVTSLFHQSASLFSSVSSCLLWTVFSCPSPAVSSYRLLMSVADCILLSVAYCILLSVAYCLLLSVAERLCLSVVYRLLSVVSCLPVRCLTSPISCLPSPSISRLPSPISRLPSPISRVLSPPVCCLPSPSCLLPCLSCLLTCSFCPLLAFYCRLLLYFSCSSFCFSPRIVCPLLASMLVLVLSSSFRISLPHAFTFLMSLTIFDFVSIVVIYSLISKLLQTREIESSCGLFLWASTVFLIRTWLPHVRSFRFV